jgi:hypothetical protein
MDCWKRPAASAPPALSSLRCRSAAGLRPPPGFERQAAAGTGALAAAGKHLAISESKLVAWKTEPVSEVDEAGIGNLCEEAVNKVSGLTNAPADTSALARSAVGGSC